MKKWREPGINWSWCGGHNAFSEKKASTFLISQVVISSIQRCLMTQHCVYRSPAMSSTLKY
ncbi:hypothetical protein O9929_12315 [Vibrio lentus]|nr:hypothetical protein [Vibrio lentus]